MKFQSAVCLSIVLMCCVGGAWGQAWVDNFQSFNPSLWVPFTGTGSNVCYCGNELLQYNSIPGTGVLHVYLKPPSPCFPECPQVCIDCASLGGLLETQLFKVNMDGAFYFYMQAPIYGNHQFAGEAFSSMGAMGSNGQYVGMAFSAAQGPNAIQFSWQSPYNSGSHVVQLSFSAISGPHAYSFNVGPEALTFYVDNEEVYSTNERIIMTEPQLYLELGLADGQTFWGEGIAEYYTVGYNSSNTVGPWNPRGN